MKKKLGLSKKEVENRIEKYGYNEIEKTHHFSPLKLFISQFTSPLIYVLIVAGGISVLLSHIVDAVIVFSAVVVNVLLGFYQEYKAERSLEELEKVITVDVEVLRSGKRRTIQMRDVVPGDLIFLKMGDKVPADGVLVSSDHLSLSEAVLTGESVSVVKSSYSGSLDKLLQDEEYELIENVKRVYMGTTVVAGLGQMIAIRTGGTTKIGQIAESLKITVREKTLLQKQLAGFAKTLTWIVIGVSLVLLGVGVLRGESFADIFLVAVAVAVSAIPEGLVVALTAILAVGMQRILKRKGLVRKLLSAEALGSVSVVCADKTGTLTKGEMTVVSFEGSEGKLIQSAICGNDLSDPLEVAMMSWGKAKLRASGMKKKVWGRSNTLPFNPSLKYGACSVSRGGASKLFVRGAPEVILEFSSMNKEGKKVWKKKFQKLASQGYRIVGFGMRKTDGDDLKRLVEKGKLEWLGILVFEDPVRSDVKTEVAKLLFAGVDFKVITGDFAETASYVMKQLGVKVDGGVISGRAFQKMDAVVQKKAVSKNVLFARFSPEDKLRVVELLQQKGEVVAMMGDGVNDAPALKKADVGIVVSSASEVAKETADMVLLDDDFETVVEGVEEGRGIFVNIRKVVLYLISDSFSEVILILGSMILGLPLPITAAQILWVNLANDSFPSLALTLEPLEKGLMEKGPRARKEPLVDGEMRMLIAIISGFTGLYVLGVFWWMLNTGYPLFHARTVAFVFLGVDSLLYVFVARSLDEPIYKIPFFSNPWLVLGVLVGMFMQIIVLYNSTLRGWFGTQPLGSFEWLLIVAGSLFLIVSIEVVKWLYSFRRES